jgi:putative hydrolase of the HAD superfamily
MKHAVSFDFWNTLYGTGDESERRKRRIKYFQKYLLKYKKITRKSVEAAFDSSFEVFMEQWRYRQQTPGTVERIRYMAKILEVHLTDAETEQIANYFGNLILTVPPQKIDLVYEVVSDLSQKYPLGIISDTGYINGRYIRRFLDREKLLSMFKSLVFSDEHPYSKPHIKVFQTTCRNLQIDCSRLIHIGDLDQTDIMGAKNAGCTSIKYAGNNHALSSETEADFIIDHYKDLPKLIASIVRKHS